MSWFSPHTNSISMWESRLDRRRIVFFISPKVPTCTILDPILMNRSIRVVVIELSQLGKLEHFLWVAFYQKMFEFEHYGTKKAIILMELSFFGWNGYAGPVSLQFAPPLLADQCRLLQTDLVTALHWLFATIFYRPALYVCTCNNTPNGCKRSLCTKAGLLSE